MKVLVVLFAVCVASSFGRLGLRRLTHLKHVQQTCIAQTRVDPTVVENAIQGQIAETDEKLQCFAACFLRKMGVMDAEGDINEEAARANLPSDVPREQVDDVINRCKGLRGSNDCQTGAAVVQCFIREKTFNLLS